MTRPFDVALFERGDQHTNTIVLAEVDLLVPVARDLDGDPLHDDEVRLYREDGHFERVLPSSHDDVEPNGASELVYRFRAVPRGLYRVSVRTAEQWLDVMTGLVVRGAGAYWNGQALASGPPPPPEEAGADAGADAGDDDGDDDDGSDAGASEGDPFMDQP